VKLDRPKVKYARLMAGEAQGQEPRLADNVALKLRPFMAARPARRGQNVA